MCKIIFDPLFVAEILLIELFLRSPRSAAGVNCPPPLVTALMSALMPLSLRIITFIRLPSKSSAAKRERKDFECPFCEERALLVSRDMEGPAALSEIIYAN